MFPVKKGSPNGSDAERITKWFRCRKDHQMVPMQKGSPNGSCGHPNGLVLLLFNPGGDLCAHQHEVRASLKL
jgi:hypothetical protein